MIALDGPLMAFNGMGTSLSLSPSAFHSFAVQLDPLKTAPPAATFEMFRPRAPQTLTLTPEAPPGDCI
jgi:hypothetical protein